MTRSSDLQLIDALAQAPVGDASNDMDSTTPSMSLEQIQALDALTQSYGQNLTVGQFLELMCKTKVEAVNQEFNQRIKVLQTESESKIAEIHSMFKPQ